jgi:5'-nucleotidase/UDP-sugar diphosphatase
MRHGGRRKIALTSAAALVALTGVAVAGTASADHGSKWKQKDYPAFTLTILHNNDGESSLLPLVVDNGDGTTSEYGGIARFQRKVDTLRWQSRWATYDRGESWRRGVVLLNSGDNYLPGTTFQASQQDGAPFYDGLAVKRLRYDALAIGNHEFDFGPAELARFIETVGKRTPFVTANLDFSNEPALAEFAAKKRIVKSTIIRERGERIGVVGLTTPSLPTISSPGGVQVLTDLAGIAQAEIDALTKRRVDKIILISHLQGLDSEIALASSLKNVDVIIGGGGDEILADEGDILVPGDEDDIFGGYPQLATDATGKQVPIVTTPGNYRYVGQLQVTFDRKGNVLSWDDDDSGIKVVTDSGPEAVGQDQYQLVKVQQPVADFVANLAATQIGSSGVVLDCERPEVRGVETNCGNLIADGLLAAGQSRAAAFGLDSPQIGIINGGGIRGEIDQPEGPISVADTFRLQPFGNFGSIAEDVPAETLRQIIEEGAIRLPASGDGGFVQVSDGTTLVIDPSFQARVADQNTGVQTTPGERVRTLILADGTVVVQDGVTQPVTVDVVGLNFSLNGGDAYPAVPNTTIGLSDQQALQNYIEDTLGGTVSAADYPRGGEGRLTIVGL